MISFYRILFACSRRIRWAQNRKSRPSSRLNLLPRRVDTPEFRWTGPWRWRQGSSPTNRCCGVPSWRQQRKRVVSQTLLPIEIRYLYIECSKTRVVSNKSLLWCTQLKTAEEASGVADFVTNKDQVSIYNVQRRGLSPTNRCCGVPSWRQQRKQVVSPTLLTIQIRYLWKMSE